jgi:hypothetical protein
VSEQIGPFRPRAATTGRTNSGTGGTSRSTIRETDAVGSQIEVGISDHFVEEPAIRELHPTMHRRRVGRLRQLGFAENVANEISEMHTANFM